MASFDYASLRDRAQAALDEQPGAKRLVMIHSGVVIGLGLVLSVLSYLLNMGIAGTGGLSGIGTRAVLETVQTVLQGMNLVLIPFWTVGYTYMILVMSRGQEANGRSLLWGFRHWGVVLRSILLQGIIYLALIMVATQLASIVFMMTPAAKPLYTMDVTDPYAMLDDQAYLAVCFHMLPYLLVGMLIFLVPVFYRMRFAGFVLADHPEQGALRAIQASFRMTRKNCLAIFKLDLRFWWFYLAQILIAVLGYGDLLLAEAGVEIVIGADAAMFIFYIAGLVCEFGLYVWRKNQVHGTYALAYEQLSIAEQTTPQQPTEPKKVPWTY